jgi:hypothetical protein
MEELRGEILGLPGIHAVGLTGWTIYVDNGANSHPDAVEIEVRGAGIPPR